MKKKTILIKRNKCYNITGKWPVWFSKYSVFVFSKFNFSKNGFYIYKLTFILNNYCILFKKAKIFQQSWYYIIRTLFFYICVPKIICYQSMWNLIQSYMYMLEFIKLNVSRYKHNSKIAKHTFYHIFIIYHELLVCITYKQHPFFINLMLK